MVDKKVVVQAIIEKAEKEFQDALIMTSLVEGYQKPDRIAVKGGKMRQYTPDVLLKRDKAVDLYSVELGKKNDYELDKWRVFSLYIKKQKGSFNIVIPEDNLPRLRELLSSNHISARILYFS